MTNARPDDLVRTTTDVPSHFGKRTIPAGTEGVVLEVNSDGTYLADVTLSPATDDRDGDYDLVTLRDGQFEVIPQENL